MHKHKTLGHHIWVFLSVTWGKQQGRACVSEAQYSCPTVFPFTHMKGHPQSDPPNNLEITTGTPHAPGGITEHCNINGTSQTEPGSHPCFVGIMTSGLSMKPVGTLSTTDATTGSTVGHRKYSVNGRSKWTGRMQEK